MLDIYTQVTEMLCGLGLPGTHDLLDIYTQVNEMLCSPGLPGTYDFIEETGHVLGKSNNTKDPVLKGPLGSAM